MARTTFSGPVRSLNGFEVGEGATVTRILRGSASLDFPSINAVSQADLTITVTGAAVGDTVVLGLPAAPTAGITFNAFVSAANTVTVRATNVTAGAIDPAAAVYTVLVMRSA
jgi:hypothetical protein